MFLPFAYLASSALLRLLAGHRRGMFANDVDSNHVLRFGQPIVLSSRRYSAPPLAMGARG